MNTLGRRALFSVCVVLPLQECEINGILRYVSFRVWLLSLGVSHLGFIHVTFLRSLLLCAAP